MATSQADEAKKVFTISLAPNLIYYGSAYEDFNYFREEKVYPHLGLGVEVDYAPLWTIFDLNVIPTLVVAYGQYQTDQFGAAKDRVQVSHLPVLVGARLTSSGRLKPFVRLLAGVSRSRFEISSDFASWNIKTFRWEPCLDSGAGLEFDISENLGIAATVDQWVFFSKLGIENQNVGLPYRHVTFNYSIRFSYHFLLSTD